MTKDEFIACWADELSGLLLRAMAEDWPYSQFKDKGMSDDKVAAAKGRFMIQQLRRARSLLERMYADIKEKPS